MTRLTPRPETIKKLFSLSGNKCAFQNCVHDLVTESNVLIGEVCHIEAAEENGPRYDSNMSDEERRTFENLILLCPTHHKIIDSDLSVYTIEKLRQMKTEHENNNRHTNYQASQNVVEQAIQSFTISQANIMRDGLQYNTLIGNVMIANPDILQKIASTSVIGDSMIVAGRNSRSIREKRLNEFMDESNISVSNIVKSKVDQEFLKSEQYFDLLNNVFVAAAKTKEKEKLSLYAQILCGVVQNSNTSIDAEEYIKQILELNPRDIRVARIIYEQQKSIPDRDNVHFKESDDFNEVNFATSNGWHVLPEKTNLSWPELSFVFHKLERAGLIAEIAGSYVDYTGGIYTITYGFKKLMGLIESNHS